MLFPSSFSFARSAAAPFCVALLATACSTSTAPTNQTPASPPADGRCGLTPRMLVAASTYPVPTDAGPVSSGAGPLVAAGSDLYYAISVVPVVAPGLSASYFDATLLRVPKAGGQSTRVATADLFLQFAITSTQLLVAREAGGTDSILSIPLAGGSPTTVLTLTSGSLGLGLASDGQYAYFGNGTGVQAVSLDADASAAGAITLTQSFESTLAVLGHQLVMALPQGQMESLSLPPKANEPVTSLGTAGTGQDDLQACGSDVCWLSEGPSVLWRMNPLVGSPVALVSLTGSFQEAHGLVFDGQDFYLSGSDGSGGAASLGRIAGDGSGPEVVVGGGVGAIAVDDECLYWAGSEGIFSLAKTVSGPIDP